MTMLFIIPPLLSPTLKMLQFKISEDTILRNGIKAEDTTIPHKEIERHLTEYPAYAFFFNIKEEYVLFKLGAFKDIPINLKPINSNEYESSLTNYGTKLEHPFLRAQSKTNKARLGYSANTAKQPQDNLKNNDDIDSEDLMPLHDTSWFDSTPLAK